MKSWVIANQLGFASQSIIAPARFSRMRLLAVGCESLTATCAAVLQTLSVMRQVRSVSVARKKLKVSGTDGIRVCKSEYAEIRGMESL